MTDFVSFARAHGVEIDHLYESKKLNDAARQTSHGLKTGRIFGMVAVAGCKTGLKPGRSFGTQIQMQSHGRQKKNVHG